MSEHRDVEVSRMVRMQLDHHSGRMTARTRRLLQPAMDRVMTAAEDLCPLAVVMTRDGPRMAYGPGWAAENHVMLAANPNDCLQMEWTSWPPFPDDLDTTFEPASIWKTACDMIDEENAEAVMRCFYIRTGRAGIGEIEGQFAALREKNFTPILFMAVAIEGTQAGGISGVLLLPESIEKQVQRAEAGG